MLLQTWVEIQINVLALYIMQFLSPPEKRKPSKFREKTAVRRAQFLAPHNVNITALQPSVGTTKATFYFCATLRNAIQDAALTTACCPASGSAFLPATNWPNCFENILNPGRNEAYDLYSGIFRF